MFQREQEVIPGDQLHGLAESFAVTWNERAIKALHLIASMRPLPFRWLRKELKKIKQKMSRALQVINMG